MQLTNNSLSFVNPIHSAWQTDVGTVHQSHVSQLFSTNTPYIDSTIEGNRLVASDGTFSLQEKPPFFVIGELIAGLTNRINFSCRSIIRSIGEKFAFLDRAFTFPTASAKVMVLQIPYSMTVAVEDSEGRVTLWDFEEPNNPRILREPNSSNPFDVSHIVLDIKDLGNPTFIRVNHRGYKQTNPYQHMPDAREVVHEEL